MTHTVLHSDASLKVLGLNYTVATATDRRIQAAFVDEKYAVGFCKHLNEEAADTDERTKTDVPETKPPETVVQETQPPVQGTVKTVNAGDTLTLAQKVEAAQKAAGQK